MKILTTFIPLSVLMLTIGFSACSQSNSETFNNTETTINFKGMTDSNEWNNLSPEEERVIVNKGTEMAWKGEFVDHHEEGVFTCGRCNAALFKADDKFDSRSGWPAFDDALEGAVKEIPDADGHRIEIVCANCDGHLGHVFKGENMTTKNTRHCVNSISMNFVAEEDLKINDVKTDTAIFASGCFWGTEYFFEKAEGVISTQVGYIGGHKDNPTYKEVCDNQTGHAEAVLVVFDPSKTDYETLAKLFFETHDPTQVDRQGPGIGTQYRTEIFYINDDQKVIAEKLKQELIDGGLVVTTEITEATKFWDGEDYHEHYYTNKGGTPYCHGYTKRFE